MSKKILIIRFGSLGDVILASATALNLRISFPDSQIVFLTKERFRPIVQAMDSTDEVVTIPDRASVTDFARQIATLYSGSFDIIVDLHGNIRSTVTRKLISAGRTVVYPKRRWERFKAVRSKKLSANVPHTIDLYNDTVRQLEGKVAAIRPVLNFDNFPNEAGQRNFDADGREYVVIAPGAAHPNKQWPLERFVEVGKLLTESSGVRVVWAATEVDSARLQEMRGSGSNESHLIDWPIERLAPVIAKARLTIANDSGIAHLSSAVGTPVMAIFGPTHPSFGFWPRGINDRVIEVAEECRPCSLHGKKPCYRSERFCFTRIAAEDVAMQANEFLAAEPGVPALFIDRDGTIIREKHFLSDPGQIEFEDGSLEALKIGRELGFKLIILSNQSGIARGILTVDQVERVNSRLLEMLLQQGVEVAGLYYCPHHPQGTIDGYADRCQCRKPSPGMVESAAAEHNLDLRRSIVVGDKLDDLFLGSVIGAKSLLVLSGHGREQANLATDAVKQNVHENLLAAVRDIKHSRYS